METSNKKLQDNNAKNSKLLTGQKLIFGALQIIYKEKHFSGGCVKTKGSSAGISRGGETAGTSGVRQTAATHN
jgi:hypothetical protein